MYYVLGFELSGAGSMYFVCIGWYWYWEGPGD